MTVPVTRVLTEEVPPGTWMSRSIRTSSGPSTVPTGSFGSLRTLGYPGTDGMTSSVRLTTPLPGRRSPLFLSS